MLEDVQSHFEYLGQRVEQGGRHRAKDSYYDRVVVHPFEKTVVLGDLGPGGGRSENAGHPTGRVSEGLSICLHR